MLDTWKQDLVKLPTIGEIVEVDTTRSAQLDGYQDKAAVSRIDLFPDGREAVIFLDAVPRKAAAPRTLVILNANYIPKSLHRQVEKHLRSRLDLPVFEWQACNDPRPVIGIHSPSSEIRESTDRYNSEVRELLSSASGLVTIG